MSGAAVARSSTSRYNTTFNLLYLLKIDLQIRSSKSLIQRMLKKSYHAATLTPNTVTYPKKQCWQLFDVASIFYRNTELKTAVKKC